MSKALLFNIADPSHHQTLAQIMLKGGVVGSIWGHHLYFLACNGFNPSAVARMNMIKGRPSDQILASPGAVEEAEEFADIAKSKGLINASKKVGLLPLKYLEFLFKKFPLGVELYANGSAPSSVTNAAENGKTIWIAAHMGDKNYSRFLETVRNLRKTGKKIIFAGTSLNLAGENTLTVREFDKVLADFGDKLDAIAFHPKRKVLKKLKFRTSSSVVSFIGKRPKLLRLGCTKISSLQKYIPDLVV